MFSRTLFKSYAQQLPYSIFNSVAKVWGQVPVQWRLGSSFRKTFRLLNEAENWEQGRIQEWQLSRLREIMRHAEFTVPWYRKTFKSIGFHWQDIKKLEDIEYIPTISKGEISENLEAFISEEVDKKKLVKAITGGSTGAPLTFYLDKTNTSIEAAFLGNILGRYNCELGDRFLVLRTQRKSPNSKTPYWTYNPHRNQLVISSYLLSKNSLPEIVREIRRFKPIYVLGISSTAALFSNYLLETGEDIGDPPNLVLLSSENSYREQRGLISEAFKCQTIMLYGQTEGVVMAVEDSQHGKYHVNPFYGLAEILNENGKLTLNAYDQGEIVGTSFHNFVMPFIRYRTGDVATISNGTSIWGIPGSAWERIEGRTVEICQTRDGRWIMLAALLFGTHDETFSNVAALQIEQQEPGFLILRLIKRRGYSMEDERKIRHMINILTQEGFEIYFDYVDIIPRTEAGKHKLLIQHLKLPDRIAY